MLLTISDKDRFRMLRLIKREIRDRKLTIGPDEVEFVQSLIGVDLGIRYYDRELAMNFPWEVRQLRLSSVVHFIGIMCTILRTTGIAQTPIEAFERLDRRYFERICEPARIDNAFAACVFMQRGVVEMDLVQPASFAEIVEQTWYMILQLMRQRERRSVQ